MKTFLMIISISGFLTLGSCSQKMEANELLDNTETRSDIFEAIANDHEHMSLFMESIQNNKHAMEMIHGNCMMQGKMMKDSTMRNKMMGKMMQMMKDEGMMSNECMRAMREKMKDKGMNSEEMEMMN